MTTARHATCQLGRDMAEQLDLTVPQPQPTLTNYKVASVQLRLLPSPLVQIIVVNNGGGTIVHVYEGPQAQQILSAINTANFTNNSFAKTILNRLVTDGVLSGSVSGTPGL